MSILLEALRKSEQRKTLGATPGLHSPEPSLAGQEPRDWRRPLLWLLLVMVVLLVALLAWRLWPAPVSESSKPLQSAPARPAEAVAQARQERPAVPARQPRSPVEGLSSDAPFVRAQRPVTGPEAQASASTPPPVTAAGEPAPKPETAPASGNAVAAQPAPAMKAPAKKPVKKPAKKQNGGPRNAPISFWQLPENLRNSFPAGKINVLVYAEAPSDRFVVMQGKRYLEGDALGQGFKVHRIEPARVVFSHRAYRFYMTQ